MANKTLNSRIVLRNDTETNWTTNKSKVLLKGEIGLETDTHKYKIGDGSTTWENLTYYMNVPANQQFGLVDDVKIDNVSVVSSKIANANTINGDYNASTNKLATANDIKTINGNYNASSNKLATANDLPDISVKLDKKPDGTNDLISSNKITTTYLPDFLLGQVLYGGTVNANTAEATLSTNAKSRLGTSNNTITLTNDTTAITGYGANEGIFYIVSTDGTFAGLSLLVGDWLISNGSSWQKIDNTDAVTGVKGNAENSYRIGNVSISPDDLSDTSTTNKFVTASDKTNWDGKMDAANPTGTGSFSLNRKANTTIGDYSFAEGHNNTASGGSSHAEGSNTTASGYSSHAEGANTTASGNYSHAEGYSTEASAARSHAEGYSTIAQGLSQHVFGEYNIADTTGSSNSRGAYVEIVGNGTGSVDRSNARTLDWSGNEVLAGTLQSTGLKDGNNATYKVTLPDTTSWTANQEMLTDGFTFILNGGTSNS